MPIPLWSYWCIFSIYDLFCRVFLFWFEGSGTEGLVLLCRLQSPLICDTVLHKLNELGWEVCNNLQKENHLLTFFSLVYLSSGVSSPLVSALTLGPSLIPARNTGTSPFCRHNVGVGSLFTCAETPAHRYLKIPHRWQGSPHLLSRCTPCLNCLYNLREREGVQK